MVTVSHPLVEGPRSPQHTHEIPCLNRLHGLRKATIGILCDPHLLVEAMVGIGTRGKLKATKGDAMTNTAKQGYVFHRGPSLPHVIASLWWPSVSPLAVRQANDTH